MNAPGFKGFIMRIIIVDDKNRGFPLRCAILNAFVMWLLNIFIVKSMCYKLFY